MASRARILVADVPGMELPLRTELAAHDVVFVSSFDAAVQALSRETYELVVVGLHFDDSRMLNLVLAIRALAEYRDIPVVCVRGTPTRLSERARKGLEGTLRTLGCDAFIELELDPQVFAQLSKQIAPPP